jgi:hypothetical protein
LVGAHLREHPGDDLLHPDDAVPVLVAQFVEVLGEPLLLGKYFQSQSIQPVSGRLGFRTPGTAHPIDQRP